jgi:hypothetical protein
VARIDAADLAGLATVEFAPPRELTPAQGGVLLAEAVRPEHQVAWLIGAAVDGHLDLEDDGGTVTLVRLPRRDGAATYVAFGGRDRLTLGSYDPSFAAAWGLVGGELDGRRRTSPLWDPAGNRRRVLALGLGAVGGVAGLLLTGIAAAMAGRSGPGWLVLAALGGLLAGAGVAADRVVPATARYPLLAPALLSGASGSSERPSSSGSGGGGGGGVGGGAGGGGGGSW